MMDRGALLTAAMQNDDERVQSRMFGPNVTGRPPLLETRTPPTPSDRAYAHRNAEMENAASTGGQDSVSDEENPTLAR